jgi:hypothetical protein
VFPIVKDWIDAVVFSQQGEVAALIRLSTESVVQPTVPSGVGARCARFQGQRGLSTVEFVSLNQKLQPMFT